MELRLIGYYSSENAKMHPEENMIEEAICLAPLIKQSLLSLENNHTIDESLLNVLRSNTVFIFKTRANELVAYHTLSGNVRLTNVHYVKGVAIPIEPNYKSWFIPGEIIEIKSFAKSDISMLDLQSVQLDNWWDKYEVIKGTVQNVTSFGAFVNFDNKKGLIHISNISWDEIEHPGEILRHGDDIHALILDVDSDDKIQLGYKQLHKAPGKLKSGDIIVGEVIQKLPNAYLLKVNSHKAILPFSETDAKCLNEGTQVIASVISNEWNPEKHYNMISVSQRTFHDEFGKNYKVGSIVKIKILGLETQRGIEYILVKKSNLFALLPLENVSKVYIDALKRGETIDELVTVAYIGQNPYNGLVSFDMRPIEKAKRIEEKKQKETQRQQQIQMLAERMHVGEDVDAEVIAVDHKAATIKVVGSDVECTIPREELSPNKVLRASDEVFVGEKIKVKYLGIKDGEIRFSRKSLVLDHYDESLYDLTLMELMEKADIHSNQFVGKVIDINGNYFLSQLITASNIGSNDYGTLLINPQNGQNIIVRIDNRLRNLVTVGRYFRTSLALEDIKRRKWEGTPYLFCVNTPNIEEVDNPYEISVTQTFKKLNSPSANKSLSNLLDEVGIGLYRSKKRMFFELLQNADDAASNNGVKVKIEISGDYFVITHDGYSFNKRDFYSITSAAQSTKSTNKKKTGYKGIGFKSVFTNSTTVLIKSGGYTFLFDKKHPIFQDFKNFYFFVDGCVHDELRQKEFLASNSEEYVSFNPDKDIPWQLLPVWSDKQTLSGTNSIFNGQENVAIALKMEGGIIKDYAEAVKEVFNHPRFMLFLRRTRRIQLKINEGWLTIQKNFSKDGEEVTLVNSFSATSRSDRYIINSIEDIPVSDEAFSEAGISLRKSERTNNQRTNNRGEKEIFFVHIDDKGNLGSEVTGIPDRIASSEKTELSFAFELDDCSGIRPIKKNTTSFYAYLPLNEQRFWLPFYVNADFIPSSNREEINSENPWNAYLFYCIGKSIVPMVAKYASVETPNYLSLLPCKELDSTSIETSLITNAFNASYIDSLKNDAFILTSNGDLCKQNEVILDKSGLTSAITQETFLKIIGSSRQIISPEIDSSYLEHRIFSEVLSIDSKFVIEKLIEHEDLTSFFKNLSNRELKSLIEWLAKQDDLPIEIINKIPCFKKGENLFSLSEFDVSSVIIQSEKTEGITSILEEIGVDVYENICHSQFEFELPSEKKVFSLIESKLEKLSEINLSVINKLDLFRALGKLSDIGPMALSSIKLFSNVFGEITPLSEMLPYDEEAPEWLHPYMICEKECVEDLNHYLINENDVYKNIIENKIDSLISQIDISVIFNRYKDYWQSSFTRNLIKKCIPNIIYVVEQSNDDVKKDYIKTLKSFSLSSGTVYAEDTFEFRIIRLAISSEESISHLRAIMTVDEVSFKEFSLQDEFHIIVDGKTYPFSLSKLLPEYNAQAGLGILKAQFSAKMNTEALFALNEALPVDVRNKLYRYFSNSSSVLNAEQYAFLMLYKKSTGASTFDSTLRSCIRIDGEQGILDIFDWCLNHNIANILNYFLRDSYINYPCGKIYGKYFNCEEYTLPIERLPNFICSWANTSDKRDFLLALGAHDMYSNEIIRRKSFKDNKLENIWSINDISLIRSFLQWVKTTWCPLPIVNDNQVCILENLFKTLKIAETYYEGDFCDATEWANERYAQWKEGRNISIHVIDGALPSRGVFENTHLFKSKSNECVVYFPKSCKIFISSNREPASILSDAISKSNIPFNKDDWNSIFLVSADLIEERDKEIAELKRQLEETRSKYYNDDVEVEVHGRKHGRGNLSPEERKQINNDACEQAYYYLKEIDGYDCSNWDYANDGRVVKNVLYNGQRIVVVITSSGGGYIYLNPYAFAQLMENPDNLLINVSGNQVRTYSFKELFEESPDVNLIFDTRVVTPQNFAELANKFMTSKKTCFVVANPNYSASDHIKGFGLNEKMENGNAKTFSIDDLIW